MTIKERLNADLKEAMKARQGARVACLRMLKAKILEKEVELRTKHGPDHELEDEEALAVISAYAKQRRDSIDSFRQGGREDLVAKEEAELEVISSYLPRQLGRDELQKIVREAIEEAGAGSAADLGRVMKIVMPRVKGAADGKLVNQLVREELGRST